MTDATFVLNDFASFDRRPPSRRHSLRTVLAAAALALGLVTGTWVLDDMRPLHGSAASRPVVVVAIGPALRPTVSPARSVSAPQEAELAFAFSLGVSPVPLERSQPLSSAFVAAAPAIPVPPVQRADAAAAPVAPPAFAEAAPDLPPAEAAPAVRDVPMPIPRPPAVRMAEGRSPPAGHRMGRRDVATVAPAPPADNRGFLERFFGMLRPSGPTLAYAAPEDGLLGNARSAVVNPALSHDRWTAVYDIAAHTVYMPNGARLEAHSGLGELLDDPRHVDARNRGATPPHLYDLQLREQPFHGVRALRLNPVGGSGVFGRTGLLAHTYMLGPKGDSNGCVSFKDYDAFLHAYANGEVKRLVVVAGLG